MKTCCKQHAKSTSTKQSLRNAGSMLINKTRLTGFLSLAVLSGHAYAQTYPSRAVRMVVPYSAGGSVDVMARIVAAKLTERMGQQMVVDNRTGASGNIGTEFVVRAPADGYTLLMTSIPYVMNPNLSAKVPYDAEKDLAPISLITSTAYMLVVHPSLPVKSVKDLIALAKSRPGRLNYGSGGNGTNSHVATELFKYMTGVNITHVPYNGGGPEMIGLLSGEVGVAFLAIDLALNPVKTGRLRAIAFTSTQRLAFMPELPTVTESGVPGYDFSTWYGLLAPAATPPAIIKTLNDYLVKAVHEPDLTERFTKQNIDIVGNSPAQFGAFIKAELARWSKVVRAAGLHAD